MRWTGRFLVVLGVLSLGCARGDWTTETLTLVDVTGTWEGQFRYTGTTLERPIRWVPRGAMRTHQPPCPTLLNAPHAARGVARHGVRSHAVPVALVGECSIPVV
jgi:hypothetical protein